MVAFAHAGLAQSDGLAISILFGAASFIVGLVGGIAWIAYGLQLRTVKTSAHAKSMAKPYDDDTDFTCVRRVVWKAPLTSEFFGAATETVALNSARHSKSLLMSSVRLDTESVLVDLGTKRAEQTKRLRRE